jgi:hypothetical protein
VDKLVVGTRRKDLGLAAVEFFIEVTKGLDLGWAHEGKIFWIEEDYGPLAFETFARVVDDAGFRIVTDDCLHAKRGEFFAYA